MNHEELIAVLEGMVSAMGSKAQVAKKLKVSPQYLGDVMDRRRDPGPKLLKSMKLRKIETYEDAGRGK